MLKKNRYLLYIILFFSYVAAQGSGYELPKVKSDEDLEKIFNQKVEGLETPLNKNNYVIKGDIHPAIIVVTKKNKVSLFKNINTDYGLEGPSHAAYVENGSVKTVKRSTISTPGESWVLVWFTGGKGWNKIRNSDYARRHYFSEERYSFDVPFLVVFEKKPISIELSDNGLDITFPGAGGIIQFMPLLGTDLQSPEETAVWVKSLPADILKQARDWNKRCKFIPVHCREDYLLNPEKASITIRYQYRWVEINDEWGTSGEKAAPIPPIVGLAKASGMDINIKGKPVDTGSPTYWGPLWVIPGSAEVMISSSKILDLVTKIPIPDVDRTKDLSLLSSIERTIKGDIGRSGSGWWLAAQTSLHQGYISSYIPYVSERTADMIKSAAMQYMNTEVFVVDKYVMPLKDNQRDRVYLVDLRNHSERYAGDDEAPAGEILRGMWSYAFYTGDWYTVQKYWDELQASAVGSYVKNNWLIQSRFNSGGDTFNDVIVGTAAMARLSAVMGDEKNFGLFSYLLMRHLISYYSYEKGLIEFASQYDPWFIRMGKPEEMIVWDIYNCFGGLFAPFSQEGFYGPYSGFKEHYMRIGEGKWDMPDVMSRYYKTFLQDYAYNRFDGIHKELVMPEKDQAWGIILYLYAYVLDYDYEKLKAWLDASNWSSKNKRAFVFKALYDLKNPRTLTEVLHPDLNKKIQGRGIDLQADGQYLQQLDVCTRAKSDPSPFWFGFLADGNKIKHGVHKANTLKFGDIIIDDTPIDPKLPKETWIRPNWNMEVYAFD